MRRNVGLSTDTAEALQQDPSSKLYFHCSLLRRRSGIASALVSSSERAAFSFRMGDDTVALLKRTIACLKQSATCGGCYSLCFRDAKGPGD